MRRTQAAAAPAGSTTITVEAPAARVPTLVFRPVAERAGQAPLLADLELDSINADQESVLDRLGLGYATSYRTIPLGDIPYLQGRTPIGDPSAWAWEPITQTFVNTGARDYLTRDEFLATYYPDVLAERTTCRHLPVEQVQLGPGLLAAAYAPELAQKPATTAALAVYLYDRDDNLLGSNATLVTRDATRSGIVDNLLRRGVLDTLIDETGSEDPREYRVTVVHPRLFDFDAGSAVPDAQAYDLYEDSTVGNTVASFSGLGEDDAQRLAYIVPIVVTPARRQTSRLGRYESRPVVLQGPPAARLEQLAAATAERNRALQDLARRAGRSLEERTLDYDRAVAERRTRRTPRARSNAQAEAEIERVLGVLLESLTGRARLAPSDESALIQWLASAVLSGEVTEGVDYADAFYAVMNRLERGAFLPTATSGASTEIITAAGPTGVSRATLLAFVSQIMALVEDAQAIERRVAGSRQRVPVFAADTGDVVGYEEQLPDARDGGGDPTAVPVSVVRGVPVLSPDEVARAEGVIDVARVQCHSCHRWRVVQPEAMANRVDYVVRYDAAPPFQQQQEQQGTEEEFEAVEAECVRFGFDFRHALPTGLGPIDGEANVERVPMDSQYIVIDAGAIPEDLAAAAPPAMSPTGTGTLQAFGISERFDDSVDVEFGLLPGRTFTVPASATTVYALPPHDSVSRTTGRVIVVPEAEARAPTFTQQLAVPGGSALRYFCILADNAGTLYVPVVAVRGYEARQWECGDPTMDAHSSPVREILNRLRKEEDFVRIMGGDLPPNVLREALERIARLRNALHAEPEESAEQIEARTRAVAVSESSAADREWDRMAEDLDAIADQRLDAVRDFIDIEGQQASAAEMEQEEQEAERQAERQRLQRRRQRVASPMVAAATGERAKRARTIGPEEEQEEDEERENALADQIDILLDQIAPLQSRRNVLLARLEALRTIQAREGDQAVGPWLAAVPDLQNELASIEVQLAPLLRAMQALESVAPAPDSAVPPTLDTTAVAAQALAGGSRLVSSLAESARRTRRPTFYEYGIGALEQYPAGSYSRDVVQRAWLASGGAENELPTRGYPGSPAFGTFLKRTNAALKQPRANNPVLYVPYAPPGTADRLGGYYILGRFVTPDSVPALVQAIVSDAASHGIQVDPALVEQRLLADATAASATAS